MTCWFTVSQLSHGFKVSFEVLRESGSFLSWEYNNMKNKKERQSRLFGKKVDSPDSYRKPISHTIKPYHKAWDYLDEQKVIDRWSKKDSIWITLQIFYSDYINFGNWITPQQILEIHESKRPITIASVFNNLKRLSRTKTIKKNKGKYGKNCNESGYKINSLGISLFDKFWEEIREDN